MMAPERHVDEGATTVPAMIVVDAVPQPGTEHSEGRAPLRWPYSSREQQERALQAVAEAEMSDPFPCVVFSLCCFLVWCVRCRFLS